MNRVLCSTGTCIGRPNGRDWRLLEECAAKVLCDGWEFMMYDTWYGREEEIARFLRALPVAFPAYHCEKGVGERISRNEPGDLEEAARLFEANCMMARAIGAQTMVLHLWNGIHSDKNIGNNIRACARLREIVQTQGLLLTVENVVCGHADPLTHMKSLTAEYPDIRFTFDTKMAEFHGQTGEMLAAENEWLWGHIAHMHVNDYRGGYMDWSNLRTLHIGDGQVDFERMFAFVRRCGYAGDFTVEATSFDRMGAIDFDRLNRTVSALRKLISP